MIGIRWIYVCFRVINTLQEKHAQPDGREETSMKNNFAEEYAREQAIIKAYEAAEAIGNEAGMEQARADYRILAQEIENKGNAYGYFYRLFKEMKEAGNEHIDLHDTIRDEAKMIETMRDLGIESFTFSSGWSSAVESAWIFQQNGCRLEGLIELNSRYTDCFTGKREKAHGYLFSIQ